MIKKIKAFILSIFVMFGLVSCISIQPSTSYSFKDITNKEISKIQKVLFNRGAMQSSLVLFEGDYAKILDVDYMLSDMSYNDVRKINEEYRFLLCVIFSSNSQNEDFYVYEDKLYYFSETNLYESVEKVNYDDFEKTIEEVQTLHMFVNYDYGLHIQNQLTALLNYNKIWFDLEDYGIDSIVAGDEFIIHYTGEFITLDIYPGQVVKEKLHIRSIEVIEAEIAEFIILATPGSGNLALVPVDSKYNQYVLLNDEGYVVSEDGSFKKYNELPVGTIVYGSLPKSTDSIRVDGLYDYNPKANKPAPTGQFHLELIDHNNYIIDELSHNEGNYTPGTILEFYANPIMDADLAMYVNGEFYQIQTTIRKDDDYIWKYSFEMPVDEVVLEFKVDTINYLDVKSVLNIPNITVEDVVKVRYEQGYIGVAPGRLTDIMYSSDFEDKNMVLSLLEMPVYEEKGNHWEVTGGGYVIYSIMTSHEQYDIRVTNQYIFVNGKPYKFVGEYISFEFPSVQAHSFITYLDNYEAYTMEDVKIGNYEGLSEYEFMECPYDNIPENEALGYIETEIGRLYILSDNIFYINEDNINTYYLVVGEKNFHNIFGRFF